MQLIAIDRSGAPEVPIDDPSEFVRGACFATARNYARTGYEPPWLGYLAVEEGEVVGTCTFKSPPTNGEIEIGYHTNPDCEGRGVATRMARMLLALAEESDPELRVFALTKPETSASTTVLQRAGFEFTGSRPDAEDGVAWEWRFAGRRASDEDAPRAKTVPARGPAVERRAPNTGRALRAAREERTSANIYPSLSYDDAPAAIEWLCSAFGFRRRLVVPGPGGTILHSELSFGPGVILVSSAKPEQGRISPRSLRAVHGALCVQVDDPDAHFARAERAGAEIVHGLKDEDYGSRGYMAKDPEGHQWYFGTYRPGEWWDGKGEHG